MAESNRAKLARWSRRDFTKGELQGMVAYLVGDQIVDVATGGRLSKLKLGALRKVVWPVMKGAGKVGGRAGLSLAGSAARAAVPLATNPYAVGAALGYGALQTEPGQQLLEMAEDRGRMDRIRFEQALTDLEVGVGKAKSKTKSKFNSAVSKGMKAIRNSTSYGKKGVINAPKKAFKVVTQMASKINKSKKTRGKLPPKPKSKVLKLLYNSMVGLFR